MKLVGYINVAVDPTRIRRIKITCRCKHNWTEQIPCEVHDSWLVVVIFCPQCGREFHLQNKKLEAAETKSGTLPRPDSFPQSGGNA